MHIYKNINEQCIQLILDEIYNAMMENKIKYDQYRTRKYRKRYKYYTKLYIKYKKHYKIK